MDRRGFLKTTGAAAALAATTNASTAQPGSETLAAPAVHGNPIQEYRLSVPWGPSVSGPADLAHRLATRIREASDSRIRLSLDHSNSADAEFAHASEHTRTPLHPAFSYFAGLPGTAGLQGQDLETWITTAGGQDHWDQLSIEFGQKPLLAGHLGPKPVLWSNRVIDAASGLRGLRIAVEGPATQLASALGADPRTVEPARLAEALANDEIDAAEQGATLNAMAIGLPSVARYAITPALASAGTAIALRIRYQTWEQLSQADRALISVCAREIYRTSLAEARLAENLLIETLRTRGKLAVCPMPTEITSAIPHLSETIVAALSGHDTFAAKINASYMFFRRQLMHADAQANDHIS